MNEGAVASGPVEVEIVGDLCVFPVITLFGTLTAPITVNYGPNQFVYSAAVTDVVVIDTRWGRANTITVDTTAALSGNYTTPLDPGTHDFSIPPADPHAARQARLAWYNAVVGGGWGARDGGER